MKIVYVHFLLIVTLNLAAYMAEYFYPRANPKCLNSRSDRRPRRLTTCAVLCEAPRANEMLVIHGHESLPNVRHTQDLDERWKFAMFDCNNGDSFISYQELVE